MATNHVLVASDSGSGSLDGSTDAARPWVYSEPRMALSVWHPTDRRLRGIALCVSHRRSLPVGMT